MTELEKHIVAIICETRHTAFRVLTYDELLYLSSAFRESSILALHGGETTVANIAPLCHGSVDTDVASAFRKLFMATSVLAGALAVAILGGVPVQRCALVRSGRLVVGILLNVFIVVKW